MQIDDRLSHYYPTFCSGSHGSFVAYRYITVAYVSAKKTKNPIRATIITMGSVDTIGPLFQPLRLGALSLSHRVVLAPLTRMRSTKESDGVFVPNDLNVEYYAQRASPGGFMLTE